MIFGFYVHAVKLTKNEYTSMSIKVTATKPTTRHRNVISPNIIEQTTTYRWWLWWRWWEKESRTSFALNLISSHHNLIQNSIEIIFIRTKRNGEIASFRSISITFFNDFRHLCLYEKIKREIHVNWKKHTEEISLRVLCWLKFYIQSL